VLTRMARIWSKTALISMLILIYSHCRIRLPYSIADNAPLSR
jgi:hypothetical protein